MTDDIPGEWIDADPAGPWLPNAPHTTEAWIGDDGYAIIEDPSIGEQAVIEGESVDIRR